MNYNETNIHPRDAQISFDSDEHRYTIFPEGESEGIVCDSVTTVVENCFEKFDADYWANRKATPDRPAETIKAEWERKGREARECGTILHDRIERYYLGEQIEPEAAGDLAFSHFLKFAQARPLTPYRSEWKIFSEEHRLAGTLDFLAFDGKDFEIYDWKRSSKLIDSSGSVKKVSDYRKFGKGVLSNIPDSTYYHYALQVSIYRYILETKYSIEVKAGHLGTFHPAYECPYVINLPYLRDDVIRLLAERLRSI